MLVFDEFIRATLHFLKWVGYSNITTTPDTTNSVGQFIKLNKS